MYGAKLPLKNLPTSLIKQFLADAKLELRERKKTERIDKRRKFISDIKLDKFDTFSSANKAIIKHNASNRLSLPCLRNKPHHREKYLHSLLLQDWSKEFDSDDSGGDFYVYCHVDPSSRIYALGSKAGGNYGGEPFYVGKGTGRRAYCLKRNQGHGKKIQRLLTDGWTPNDIIHIPFDSLNEQKAYEIESKLIYFFGTKYQEERRDSGTLYNLDIPVIPDFEGAMQKVITRKTFGKEA